MRQRRMRGVLILVYQRWMSPSLFPKQLQHRFFPLAVRTIFFFLLFFFLCIICVSKLDFLASPCYLLHESCFNKKKEEKNLAKTLLSVAQLLARVKSYVLGKKNVDLYILALNFAASDYYQFDDLLSPEEKAVRLKVRECMEKEVAPIMAEVYFICCSFI